MPGTRVRLTQWRLALATLVAALWFIVGPELLFAIHQLTLMGTGAAVVAAQSVAWGSITGTLADQTDLNSALSGKLGTTGNGSGLTGLTKSQVGLANVDNTTDLAKPISTATQTALDGKQVAGSYLAPTGDGSGLTGLTKGQVGLANADNTADSAKVVASAAVLTTPRTINGVSFNGSANITVTAAGSTLSDNVPVSKLNSGTGANASTYWRGDGTWATPAGSSYRTLVTLGADVTDSSGANTFTDCTGLSFNVTSGTRYNFEATIWYTAAATTTGSGWAINGPTATNMSYSSRFTLTATSGTLWTATAYNSPATSNATSLTAGNIATINGTILPSANGTVVVRFMTEVDTSAIVCKAGSTLEWWTS